MNKDINAFGKNSGDKGRFHLQLSAPVQNGHIPHHEDLESNASSDTESGK